MLSMCFYRLVFPLLHIIDSREDWIDTGSSSNSLLTSWAIRYSQSSQNVRW